MPPPKRRGLAPVLGPATRLVVLGSFPGEASLAAGQYYGHPRNHFWPILSALFGIDLGALAYDERLRVVVARGVGIWDVYASCRREGSLDSAIRDAEPNDLARLTREAPHLRAIVHNGGESARSMKLTRSLGVDVFRVPSSSPANASWNLARKVEAWRAVFVAAGVA